MLNTPVLIVGGGPVGLALAVELGWRGIACTLVEQGDGTIVIPKMNEVKTEHCRRSHGNPCAAARLSRVGTQNVHSHMKYWAKSWDAVSNRQSTAVLGW